ncbi:MAG TPA: phosphoribosyltransferase family protein [Candidatus Saccharimonadia bacterium]|nr:phosphoribosyltransferase family protein [Candidatus Saccharimonadia bacterium]
MSILDRLAGWPAPHDCLGCGVEGSLLCAKCCAQLPNARVPFSADSHLFAIRSATLYQGAAKDLLWRLKSGGAQEAARVMAHQMSKLVPAGTGAVIVPVPTATSRVRQRGYDQAKLLARHLSKLTALPCSYLLARHGQVHQVGAHRKTRLEQLGNALRVRKPSAVRGSHIILVDDVTTTGATLETAANILKQAGAARVEAITFAYAPRDFD